MMSDPCASFWTSCGRIGSGSALGVVLPARQVTSPGWITTSTVCVALSAIK